MRAQPAGRINRRQNWRKDGLLSINYRVAGEPPLSQITSRAAAENWYDGFADQ
jgi:hypothetical protein